MNRNTNVTVDLDLELLHETLIALRDREHALRVELCRPDVQRVVVEITRRQLSRLWGAIAGIEDAINGATLKSHPAPRVPPVCPSQRI